MKLSPQIILNALKQRFSIEIPRAAGTSLSLGRPVFLTDPASPAPGRVSLCRTRPNLSAAESWKFPFLILYQGPEEETEEIPSDKMLKLPSSCGLPEVFNLLQELFDRYDAWDEKLNTLTRQDSNIQELLDASFPIFGNPLLLRAADFSLLACSSMIDADLKLSHLTDPETSFETLSICKLDPLYMNAGTYRKPFYLPEYLSGSKELCVNLFQHGNYSHRLILSEELTPLAEELPPLLEHLAGYVQTALSHSDQGNLSSGYSLEHLLADIISKKQTNYSLIDSRLSEFGWYSSHSYCCMSLKVTSLDQQNLTTRYLCSHFEKTVPGSCAFPYGEELVIFVNLTRYDGTVDQMVNRITFFLRDNFLKTGVSSPIQGTMELQHCYTQSRIALETGSKYQTYRWIHKFEDISLYYLLECCTRELPTYMVCSPKILALKSYDIQHHSEYCKTLETYLDTHLNAVQASQRLFIHRSTFLYRLDRIRELINIDFDDSRQLFYLMLSFRLLELRKSASSEAIELHS